MIRGELVEFRALKVTCVLVSLACPISPDVLINANRSEESLGVAEPATRTGGVLQQEVRDFRRQPF